MKDSLMRTGCLVKSCLELCSNQKKAASKLSLQESRFMILVYLVLLTVSISVFANSNQSIKPFSEEKSTTYTRWNLFASRDQINFQKKEASLVLKFLNEKVYSQIKNSLSEYEKNNYIDDIIFNDQDSNGVYSIQIVFVDSSVESFNFYRERDKKYVIDFWRDGESNKSISTNLSVKNKKESSTIDKLAEVSIIPVKKVKSDSVNLRQAQQKESVLNEVKIEDVVKDKELSKIVFDPNNPFFKSEEDKEKEDEKSKLAYRDFRYGATLIWDYEPIVPTYKPIVDLSNKTPEFFYQVPNRDPKKGESEAHLQLTINLYRQKKWGLMNKSIKLFEKKYGVKKEWELIEFLKANTMFRENIDSPNPEMFKNAISMISNLSEKSENYEMKKALYKFLLTYHMQRAEYLKSLQLAKSYYSSSRDNFDFEESVIPAEAMLYSLARLGQIDKISELAEEKNFKKVLNPQTIFAYQIYGSLKKGNVDDVIKLYEAKKNAIARPVHPVILYNTAEAYFRLGKFQEALTLFQEFKQVYSYELVASHALLRIALCSDLLDKNSNEVLDLYKKAIDYALDEKVNYEARIRYVAYRTVRKLDVSSEDLETRIFLEPSKTASQILDKNLQRLLQQVRLRSLIVDKKYKEALSYLTLIPMISMTKIESRVFDGDGAEIVYGIMSEFFKKAEYAQVIKTWKTYKDQYVVKVAQDPYLNFVVGTSYVKLGLYKGFDEQFSQFEKLKNEPSRTFPVWINRENKSNTQELLTELNLIKDLELKNNDLVKLGIIKLEKINPNFPRLDYYNGLISYQLKDYAKAVSFLEKFFSKQKQKTVYDQKELADLLKAYSDSIYELGQMDKYLKVSSAILNDTNKFGTENAYVQNIRERIAYLGVEIASSKRKDLGFDEVNKMTKRFMSQFEKSTYIIRVKFLQGQLLAENLKTNEARDLLSEIIEDKNASDHLKQLSRSELSLINLKEKTI